TSFEADNDAPPSTAQFAPLEVNETLKTIFDPLLEMLQSENQQERLQAVKILESINFKKHFESASSVDKKYMQHLHEVFLDVVAKDMAKTDYQTYLERLYMEDRLEFGKRYVHLILSRDALKYPDLIAHPPGNTDFNKPHFKPGEKRVNLSEHIREWVLNYDVANDSENDTGKDQETRFSIILKNYLFNWKKVAEEVEKTEQQKKDPFASSPSNTNTYDWSTDPEQVLPAYVMQFGMFLKFTPELQAALLDLAGDQDLAETEAKALAELLQHYASLRIDQVGKVRKLLNSDSEPIRNAAVVAYQRFLANETEQNEEKSDWTKTPTPDSPPQVTLLQKEGYKQIVEERKDENGQSYTVTRFVPVPSETSQPVAPPLAQENEPTIARRQLISTLRELLNDTDVSVRQAAQQQLLEIDPGYLEEMMRKFCTTDFEKKLSFIAILREFVGLYSSPDFYIPGSEYSITGKIDVQKIPKQLAQIFDEKFTDDERKQFVVIFNQMMIRDKWSRAELEILFPDLRESVSPSMEWTPLIAAGAQSVPPEKEYISRISQKSNNYSSGGFGANPNAVVITIPAGIQNYLNFLFLKILTYSTRGPETLIDCLEAENENPALKETYNLMFRAWMVNQINSSNGIALSPSKLEQILNRALKVGNSETRVMIIRYLGKLIKKEASPQNVVNENPAVLPTPLYDPPASPIPLPPKQQIAR
ncbi:MAG: hypothetical protein KDA65_17935, partial [Planctomycetaceae bacterium]|nr:hypothetical protein [Planctomycetaceae bacterium]